MTMRNPRKDNLYGQLVTKVKELVVNPVEDCVEWEHSLSRGYGQVRVPRGKGMAKVHQVSYKIAHGELEGLVVRHMCHNPACFNPAHLTKGTDKENSQDCIDAGRYVNGRQVLSTEDIENMRAEYTGAYGEASKLARKYGVSSSQAHRILKGGYRSA